MIELSSRERLAFRLMVATAGVTFLLLMVGGLVSATGSGLACPDWPACYGTFFPHMEGKVLYEHTHRIYAFVVGNLTILNLVLVWRAKRAGHPARALAVACLGTVIFQGVLGGITVRHLIPTAVVVAHLATSMAFFALLLWSVFRLRPRTEDWPLAPRLQRQIGGTAFLVYAQIVLGAVVRHTRSALAVTSFPFWKAAAFSSNAPLGATSNDSAILIQLAHRGFALLVAAAVITVSVRVLRSSTANRLARLLALVAPGLVIVQIFLGAMSVVTALDVITVTAHLGCGALLLATMTSMWLASAAATGAGATVVPLAHDVRGALGEPTEAAA